MSSIVLVIRTQQRQIISERCASSLNIVRSIASISYKALPPDRPLEFMLDQRLPTLPKRSLLSYHAFI